MKGPHLDRRRREHALIACALLLPVPLFAVAGSNLPLPGAVEREIASLVPGSERDGLDSGTAPGGAGAQDVGALPVDGRDVATGSRASFASASGETEASSRSRTDDGPDGSDPGPGGTEPEGQGAPSQGDAPPGDEGATVSTGTGEPAPGSDSGTGPSLRIRGDSGEALVVVSADGDGVGVDPDPEGGEGDPLASISMEPGDGTTTEIDTRDLPELPIP